MRFGALARSLCVSLLLLPLRSDALPDLPDASEQETGTLTTARAHDLLLARVLDAEQRTLEHQIDAHKRKAAVLKALLAHYEEEEEQEQEATSPPTPTQARRATLLKQNRQRAHRQQHQHASDQRFSDWFDRQSAFHLPVDRRVVSQDPYSVDGCLTGDGSNERYRVDLLSFRPIATVGGKKNQRAHQTVSPSDSPSGIALHQFLALVDTSTGRIDLLHPTTQQIVWQHHLFPASESPSSSSSPIADFFFVSERKSFLAVLRESGEVSLFKLRVLHNRRLLSGDHRLSSRFDRAVCARCSEDVHFASRSAFGEFAPFSSWSASARKTTPAANHLHVDFELIFRADASRTNTRGHQRKHKGKVAVVSLYSNAYVVTASSDGDLAFFHAENGTFIKTVSTGGSASVTHFKALASGVLAFASGSHVRFVNAADQTLVRGVACEATTTDTITSVESDPWHHSLLFAGTSSGRGLVFRLLNFDRVRRSGGGHRPSGHEGDSADYVEQPACVLIGQLLPKAPPVIPPEQPSSAFVRAIPGFVVMATSAQIALFQTSSDGVKAPIYVTEYALANASQQFVGLSVSRDPLVHPVALAVHVLEQRHHSAPVAKTETPLRESRLRVDVYESLLPQPTSSLDLGWLRAPVMLVCAVAVMYWQQRGANANASHSRQGDLDVAAFARMVAARGGGGCAGPEV